MLTIATILAIFEYVVISSSDKKIIKFYKESFMKKKLLTFALFATCTLAYSSQPNSSKGWTCPLGNYANGTASAAFFSTAAYLQTQAQGPWKTYGAPTAAALGLIFGYRQYTRPANKLVGK